MDLKFVGWSIVGVLVALVLLVISWEVLTFAWDNLFWIALIGGGIGLIAIVAVLVLLIFGEEKKPPEAN